MYCKKSLGPRMDHWGTPALIGYSCEDFPSRTTRSCLLLRIEEVRANIWPENQWNLSLWRRLTCRTLSKPLDISSATARVAPDLLKALAILLDTTVRRSAVDQKDLQPYRKSEKKHFSWWLTMLLFTSFSKILHRKKTNWVVVFSCRHFPNILLYRDHQGNLLSIWKTKPLQTVTEEFS